MILLCSTELEHLTWTKISDGIRCWEQFNSDRDAVNDPQNTADVLVIWVTQSFLDAQASAWVFDSKLELPPQTAKHSDVLEIAREAFHAAAGLPHEWPRGIAFLAVHCEISKMMSADDASVIQIPVRGFLQAGQSKSSKCCRLHGTVDRCEADYAAMKSSSAHQLRLGARARDGSRYLCTGNSARTTPAGLPMHGRRARRPFFRLQFGPGPTSSAHTHSNCRLFDRHAQRAPRRPRHRNLPRPRPTTRQGATGASPV